MVFQNYALFPHLSVADNIIVGLSVRKASPDETAKRLKDAAELPGLTHLLARKPSQLSGGQQQRVALGRALVQAELAAGRAITLNWPAEAMHHFNSQGRRVP